MTRPDDYIHLDTAAPRDASSTLTDEVREIIRRLYDQEFTCAQVIRLVKPPASREYHKNAVRDTVRRIVRNLIEDGTLEVVKPPRIGGGNRRAAGIYKNRLTV